MRTIIVSLGPILEDGISFIELILQKYKQQRIVFVVESSHEHRLEIASAGSAEGKNFGDVFEKMKKHYFDIAITLFAKDETEIEIAKKWIDKYFNHIESICYRIKDKKERYEWIAFHLDKLQSGFFHLFLNKKYETAQYKKGQKFIKIHDKSKKCHARVLVNESVAMIQSEFFVDDKVIYITEGGVGTMTQDRLRAFSLKGSDVVASLIATACNKEKTEVIFPLLSEEQTPHDFALRVLGAENILHTAGTVKNITQYKIASSAV